MHEGECMIKILNCLVLFYWVPKCLSLFCLHTFMLFGTARSVELVLIYFLLQYVCLVCISDDILQLISDLVS